MPPAMRVRNVAEMYASLDSSFAPDLLALLHCSYLLIYGPILAVVSERAEPRLRLASSCRSDLGGRAETAASPRSRRCPSCETFASKSSETVPRKVCACLLDFESTHATTAVIPPAKTFRAPSSVFPWRGPRKECFEPRVQLEYTQATCISKTGAARVVMLCHRPGAVP